MQGTRYKLWTKKFLFWVEKIGEKVHTRNCRYIKHLINDKKS